MKKFTIALLGAVFVALIACSIQSISADHEWQMGGEGIFVNKSEVNLVTTQNSDYQVYLQAVLRNGDGQLINMKKFSIHLVQL
jgi:Phr family secreted Rap phosphatase inhibitor